MDSILLLHDFTTCFGLFKSSILLIKPFLDLITVFRMIILANQNELHHWHHPKSTNGIKAGPPDKKRQWQCVHLIRKLRNIREEALNGLSCLSLNQMLHFVCANQVVTKTLTGVRSSGVEMGELSLLSLIPLPRSKSQIFTGEICKKQVTSAQKNDYPQLTGMTTCLQSAWKPQIIWSNFLNHKCSASCQTCRRKRLTLCSFSHKMFSGFRSLWAIPTRSEASHALVVWYSG